MTTEPTKDGLQEPNGDTARTTTDSAATTKTTTDSAATTKTTTDSAATTKTTTDSAATTKTTTDSAATTKTTTDSAATTKTTTDSAATTKTTTDSAVTVTPAGSAATKTTTDSAATKTTTDSAAPVTPAGSAATKTTTDSAATKTTTDSAATVTPAGSAVTKTTTDSAAPVTPAGSAVTKTTTDSAAPVTPAGSAATKTTTYSAAPMTPAGDAATVTPAGGSKSNACKKIVDTTKTTVSEPPAEPTKTVLDKELEAFLSLGPADPPPHDVLMIQSEPNGTVDILKADPTLEDPNMTTGKGPPPPLKPATTWTSANLREFKHRMASEKQSLLTIRRGEVLTVRVPTHPDGKRLCWEFATDDYDIGFGIYFDWTPVTSTAVTLQVSESSDDEEEEETESPWHSREGDVERGSVYRLRSRYGEIMQVYRRDSHREVQAGSHEYPGEGVYLLKLDNSYSLLRNKTLYFHVYYSS
ncbi:protein TMED8 isoform X1 [Hyla sarda]|uniref:protein TMED8 isoform X1 n=2 Tax=Hyla sarda TaxID=327740 RepID=UPI0024C3E7AD|nr:protein TMED8 isoform X1 [Hyla sarda]XP_056408173.1 protein TMED8 isoform X1 [Hyla sarda]